MKDLLEQLQQLAPLAAAATAGPWHPGHLCNDDHSCNCPYVLCELYHGSICSVETDNGKEISEGGNDAPPLGESKANQQFIAAARNLLTPANLTLLVAALAPQWVAVTDRLPKETGIYLVFGNCTGEDNSAPVEDMAAFYPEAAIFSKYRQPTHWMPLPQAPAMMEGAGHV